MEELLVKSFSKTYSKGKVIEVTQELQECQIHKQLTAKTTKKTCQLHQGVLLGILGWEGIMGLYLIHLACLEPIDKNVHTPP